MKCIVTGASGFLGREVHARLARDHDVVGLGHRQGSSGMVKLDLRGPDTLRDFLDTARPDAVIHCAAYREPDFCEAHPEETHRLNVAPLQVMCESLSADVQLVFVSSDYVFAGDNPPYTETSPVDPINEYGRSKVEGEELMKDRRNGMALRVPLLVGYGDCLEDSGLIGEMIAAVLDRTEASYDDVAIRFPTWTRDVGEVIAALLQERATGTWQYAGLRGDTRYRFTVELAELMGRPHDHLSPTASPPQKLAARPDNSELSTAKIQGAGLGSFTDFSAVVRQALLALDVR